MSHGNRTLPLILALLAALAFVFAIGGIVRNRLRAGDIFPEYSSLRADPKGLGVLHDVLEEGGTPVARLVRPLAEARVQPGETLVVAGVPADSITGTDDLARDLDQIAARGVEVIVLLRPEGAYGSTEDEMREKGRDLRKERLEAERKERERQRAEDRRRRGLQDPVRSEPGKDTPEVPALAPNAVWDVQALRARKAREEELPPIRSALRAAGDDLAAFPETAWISGSLRFEAGPKWRVLYELDDKPVVVRSDRLRGRVTLIADSYVLSNEGIAAHRPAGLIRSLFPSGKRVVFHEHHLGVEDNRTLADLLRGYGLGPAMIAVMLAIGLTLWRSGARLVPARPETNGPSTAPAVSGASALQPLLLRAVRPADLPARMVGLAAELPQRHRPDATRLERMRNLLQEARWQKPPLAPLELYRRLAALTRRRR